MPDERRITTRPTTSSGDVIAFYDEYAADWDTRFGDAPSAAEFHRERLATLLRLARFRPADRVAELGVGTGLYLDAIAPRVAEVLCIDGSAGMLAVLQSKHGSLPNIRVLQADLERPLQDAGEARDVIYGFGVIEHIIDVDAFMANCRHLLGPAGRMVLVCSNARSPWYGALRRLWRGGTHCSTDRYYTVQALDRTATAHGFIPEGMEYWGYFPAGASAFAAALFKVAGRIIDRTPFRKFAGGLTRSYRLADE